jgi:glycosyltransferase involved in cell wall biosynthesis
MSLLRHLGKLYEITYAVIIPVANSNYTKEELGDFCREQDIQYRSYPLTRRFRHPANIATYWKIIGDIKAAQPDIVYFANFDQPYLNMLVCFLKKETTIIALHDVESHSQTAFGRLADLSRNILIRRFRFFHTYSLIQQKLLEQKAPGKSVFRIPLPLIGFGDLPMAAPRAGLTRFLFFGNILYYKGLDILLKAFRRLVSERPNVELTIAGRCKDWEENYSLLVEGVQQVNKQIRFIANEEIPGFFSNADYVVLPYRDTTQSGPLMIAYHYNVPVLASRAEGFREFFEEGVSGFSFDLHNEDSIVKVLRDAVDRSGIDYDLLKKSLANYTETNYSIPVLMEKYRDMFSHVRPSVTA